ncbi:MAG: SpoIIIAH-like family protein [Desulfitobacterium sp.]|nr:SpoIIIAH-like family protein [Desulfitobacterium sp.]
MKIFVLKRWSEMSYKHQLVLCSLILGSSLIIVGVWNIFLAQKPAAFSGEKALPVSNILEEEIFFTPELTTLKPQGEDYFVNYRLQREVTRQEAKEMLSPLLNSSVEPVREEAQKKWLLLTQKVEQEEQMENILKISGFEESIADLGKDEVAIIVYAPELTSEEIKLIQESVRRVIHFNNDQIRIFYRQ